MDKFDNMLFIKKASRIVGLGIMILSVIMFLAFQIAHISGVIEHGDSYSVIHFIIGFTSPFSTLISGFGFGSIVILLGCLIKTEEVVNRSENSATLTGE